MASASPTTYAVLGLLAARPWTGYELTMHLRRSLRFVWPSSEGHLYREQNRLVSLGWATVDMEASGRRKRKRYSITPAGRAALHTWLEGSPDEPRFEVEGMLRLFHANHGTVDALVSSLEATAAAARDMANELASYAAEYLEEGGPLWMLENGLGGPDARQMWQGREVVPERLPVVALVIEGTTRLLDTLARFSEETAADVRSWETPTDPDLGAETRARLETITTRARPRPTRT